MGRSVDKAGGKRCSAGGHAHTAAPRTRRGRRGRSAPALRVPDAGRRALPAPPALSRKLRTRTGRSRCRAIDLFGALDQPVGPLRETPKTYLGSGAIPNNRSVLRSRSPWNYLSSSRWNTDPAGDTHANKVAQDLSFI